jgi:hypothetical protein
MRSANQTGQISLELMLAIILAIGFIAIYSQYNDTLTKTQNTLSLQNQLQTNGIELRRQLSLLAAYRDHANATIRIPTQAVQNQFPTPNDACTIHLDTGVTPNQLRLQWWNDADTDRTLDNGEENVRVDVPVISGLIPAGFLLTPPITTTDANCGQTISATK